MKYQVLDSFFLKREKSLAGENKRARERASHRESSAISRQSARRLKVPKQPQSTSKPRAIVIKTRTMKNRRRQLINRADDFG